MNLARLAAVGWRPACGTASGGGGATPDYYVDAAMASGPQIGSTALGYVTGTDSQLVVMQCNACGQQRRAIRGEYEKGKYDPKPDPTHAHALALLAEVEKLNDELAKLKGGAK